MTIFLTNTRRINRYPDQRDLDERGSSVLGASCKRVCLVKVFDTLSGLIIAIGEVYSALENPKRYQSKKRLNCTIHCT